MQPNHHEQEYYKNRKWFFFLLRRYKLKPDREKLDAKETSLAMVDNKNEQMMTSSGAVPNEQ